MNLGGKTSLAALGLRASLLCGLAASPVAAHAQLVSDFDEAPLTWTSINYHVRLAIADQPVLQADAELVDYTLDSDHFVTLVGTVDSKRAKALAEYVVGQVDGVRWVLNKLRVVEPLVAAR